MTGFWEKALQAAGEARFLLEAARYDAAANRAYYAMFNAARSCLEAKTDLDVIGIRRHSAVLQLFSLHIVKPGLADADLAAGLKEVFDARAIADYDREHIPADEARELVALMDRMLSAAASLVGAGDRA